MMLIVIERHVSRISRGYATILSEITFYAEVQYTLFFLRCRQMMSRRITDCAPYRGNHLPLVSRELFRGCFVEPQQSNYKGMYVHVHSHLFVRTSFFVALPWTSFCQRSAMIHGTCKEAGEVFTRVGCEFEATSLQ